MHSVLIANWLPVEHLTQPQDRHAYLFKTPGKYPTVAVWSGEKNKWEVTTGGNIMFWGADSDYSSWTHYIHLGVKEKL